MGENHCGSVAQFVVYRSDNKNYIITVYSAELAEGLNQKLVMTRAGVLRLRCNRGYCWTVIVMVDRRYISEIIINRHSIIFPRRDLWRTGKFLAPSGRLSGKFAGTVPGV